MLDIPDYAAPPLPVENLAFSAPVIPAHADPPFSLER